MEPERLPPSSLETDMESRPTKLSQDLPNKTRKWPRPSPVTVTQVCIIVLSLVCLVMALVPLADLNHAGENYEAVIKVFAGASLAFFLALLLNATELAARRFRPGHNPGINHPKWFFGLTIFVLLCCLAATALFCVWVGVKLRDKTNIFINYDVDWCRDKNTRKLVTCPDGFYGREAYFIVVMVLTITLTFLQGFLCCTWRRKTGTMRKSQRP